MVSCLGHGAIASIITCACQLKLKGKKAARALTQALPLGKRYLQNNANYYNSGDPFEQVLVGW
jgi:hypothetical protein